MNAEEDKGIEIKPVDENESSAENAASGEAYAAKAGGKAEVTLRLLTQEEFDRHEAERKAKEEKAAGE
jgi:hypothetical protein